MHEAERSLGVAFPPDYRDFLLRAGRLSDGCELLAAGIDPDESDRDPIVFRRELTKRGVDTTRYIFLGHEELEGGFYLLDLRTERGEVVIFLPGPAQYMPLGQTFTEYLTERVDGWIDVNPEAEPIDPTEESVVSYRSVELADALAAKPSGLIAVRGTARESRKTKSGGHLFLEDPAGRRIACDIDRRTFRKMSEVIPEDTVDGNDFTIVGSFDDTDTLKVNSYVLLERRTDPTLDDRLFREIRDQLPRHVWNIGRDDLPVSMFLIGRGITVFREAFAANSVPLSITDAGIDTRLPGASNAIVDAIRKAIGTFDLIVFSRDEIRVDELETFDDADVVRLVATTPESPRTVFMNCVRDLVEFPLVDRYCGIRAFGAHDGAAKIVKVFQAAR